MMPAQRRMALVKEQTRELILDASEGEFARWGFHSARLSDIADIVGVTRTSVLYHFKDKQSLYDAMLARAFKDLTDQVLARLEDEVGYVRQIEGMVETWIECSASRPTLARLFLREVANAEDGFRPEVEALVTPLFSRVIECLEAGRRSGAFRKLEPMHLVTILAGATTWYATSASMLRSKSAGALTEEERFLAYREELMRVTRFLLGTLASDSDESA
jgi:TetR/AcrR family transcriptional regulator